MKHRVIRDIRTFLSMKKKKIIINRGRVGNIWSNVYNEYGSKSYKNKTLSVFCISFSAYQFLTYSVNFMLFCLRPVPREIALFYSGSKL